MTDHASLNRYPGKIIGPEPEDEAMHFLQCEDCGQWIDCRRLGDVLHHEEPGHDPLPLD